MSRFKTLCGISLATLLFAPGCDKEEGVPELVDDMVNVLNDQVTVFCDCFDELGWDSRSECRTNNGELLPAQRRCVQDALSRNEDASRDWLNCFIPLQREYLTCINSRLACDDFDSIDNCEDDFDVGADSCIELPTNVDRAWDECFDTNSGGGSGGGGEG